MTFDAKLKLQAGFPTIYMFAFSLVALGIPVFLAFKSYQTMLDWIWTGLISVCALFVLLRIFQQQAKQRAYSLVCEGDGALMLVEARSGDDKRYSVTRSSFTLQTNKIVFASLTLDDSVKKHLIFHGFLNHADTFRRFKVQLKWSQASVETTAETPSN